MPRRPCFLSSSVAALVLSLSAFPLAAQPGHPLTPELRASIAAVERFLSEGDAPLPVRRTDQIAARDLVEVGGAGASSGSGRRAGRAVTGVPSAMKPESCDNGERYRMWGCTGVGTRIGGAALTVLLGTGADVVQAQTRGDDCSGLVFGEGRRSICLPQGESSFADEVVSFAPGARPSSGVWADATHALGLPDYTKTTAPGFLSLGCDGVLVLRFTDNALVDVEGPDLFVFEVGPAVEATELAISEDGRTWIDVGRIEGSRADVDIASFVTPAQSFAYVRLTNASRTCGGRHSGADIDAVAAVGSALRLSLDGAVLFDTSQATLKPAAQEALAALLPRISAYGASVVVTVEGHTDSVGDDAVNQRLSEARARTVGDALASRLQLAPARVTTVGHGETRPVASNDTDAGRARNRRVDIIVRPAP